VSGLELGHIHHSLNEVVKAIGLLLDDLIKLLLHFSGNRFFANGGDGRFDRCQGRAQIVGDGVEQGGLQLLAAAELARLGRLGRGPLKVAANQIQLFSAGPGSQGRAFPAAMIAGPPERRSRRRPETQLNPQDVRWKASKMDR